MAIQSINETEPDGGASCSAMEATSPSLVHFPEKQYLLLLCPHPMTTAVGYRAGSGTSCSRNRPGRIGISREYRQRWWAGIQSGRVSSGQEEVQKVTLMASGGKRGA